MKRMFMAVLLSGMILSLNACGNSSAGEVSSQADDTVVVSDTTEKTDTSVATEVATETEATEAASDITEVGVGQSIETDNFKMVVESMEILDEYSYSTGDYSSTNLLVEDGYKLLMVQGTMENTGSDVISDYSFYKTCVVNDNYEVGNDDVRLCFERQKSYELDPYTEMQFDLYINIPEKLAEQFDTATFTLGFKDDMSVLTVTNYSSGETEVDANNWFSITK
jgi:hypothetical protein